MSNENKIEVIKATYVDGYRLSIVFNDGKESVVDFSEFITSSTKASLQKYKELDNFKGFKIEEGNVIWGKDWDLIFPVDELYNGKINLVV